MAAKDIIVIGASAGGFEAIQKIVSELPLDLPASVFVTIHISTKSDSILPRFVDQAGLLKAAHPRDGELIERGRIYVAPPDLHLLIRNGYIDLSHGPRENLQRPCINAMFRSAAAAYRERVVGVLLTGLLDDGSAGLWEIQQQNGTTIVQDPSEATFPSMPESAIRGLNVQYIEPLHNIATLLTKLAMSHPPEPLQFVSTKQLVKNALQTCPECGGAMNATQMGTLREYRCHIGHRFGLGTMIEQKSKNIERILEMALAQSEELGNLMRASLKDPSVGDRDKLAAELEKRAREQQTLRSLTD